MPTRSPRIASADLRWRCDPAQLPCDSSADVEPLHPVTGHEDAVEALRYGLAVRAPGQNIYVRGLIGTGRERMVRRLLEEISPGCPEGHDLCYVHDFRRPERPRLIRLPRGQAGQFRESVADLVAYIDGELAQKLNSEELTRARKELEQALAKTLSDLGEPFDAELASKDLRLVNLELGGESQVAIVPTIDGEPAGPDQLTQLQKEGKLDEQQMKKISTLVAEYGARFEDLSRRMHLLREQHRAKVAKLFEQEARRLLRYRVGEIETRFPIEAVHLYLCELIEDVIKRRLGPKGEDDPSRLYQVNVLIQNEADESCAIIIETTPTVENLLGSIQPRSTPEGVARADHLMISAGSLLRASGGYLVLEARDVLSEPGAWTTLMRCLRTSQVEIGQVPSGFLGTRSLLNPEAIAIDVKVVLIGDPGLYQALDSGDPDFPFLFKILSDFETVIPRDAEGLRRYAGALARLAKEERLPAFDRDAIAALAEHGARIAGRQDRLSVRFGRLMDIAREAAFLTNSQARATVGAENIIEAVRRGRRRADLPARRFREEILRGTIRIQQHGQVVGQINGLAVVHSGPQSYGFPARITATVGAGSAGAINIEREAQLSGSIHTKGFYILGGLLRYLLQTPHPQAFSASIAFEQSYGGIDGDSASGAEICCLLSALTGVPIRQQYAMTGAIDQHGHIQAIGAATEKIEGFFDVCQGAGLTGEQGVLIPSSNVGDLMLRLDVVEACEQGRFHVFGVDSVQQALEILTGVEAGERRGDGSYPEGSLLARAVEQSRHFWEQASSSQGGGRPS